MSPTIAPRRLLLIRLALATAGIVIFGFGVRTDHNNARWAGIFLVAAAAVLRFARRTEFAHSVDEEREGSEEPQPPHRIT